MRNPNGFGSVYKLSGKRRKPWVARITTGFQIVEDKKRAYPVYKFIGYFETRAEALRALALYQKEPEALSTITLWELYDQWSEEHFKDIKETRHYDAAFQALKPLWNHQLNEITIRMYEETLEESGKNRPTLQNAKIILNLSYQFAFRKGYIDENKAQMPSYISLKFASNESKTNHKPFTKDEIEALWSHQDNPEVQIILFLIYTGLRISELANLRKESVQINEQYLEITESKTKAGIRKVPIADKVMFIVSAWMASERPLFAPIGKSEGMIANYRRKHFIPTTEAICGESHLPHDTRYTCAARMTEEEVDDRFIKLILGHKSQDVTNKIYAQQLDISVLLEAVNKI